MSTALIARVFLAVTDFRKEYAVITVIMSS